MKDLKSLPALTLLLAAANLLVFIVPFMHRRFWKTVNISGCLRHCFFILVQHTL